MLKAHQFPVVEDPSLVDVREFLGEWDGVLPVLAALQQVDHVQVQLLLPLPLLLRRVSERRRRQDCAFILIISRTVGSVSKCNIPPPMQRRLDVGKRPSEEGERE